VSQRKEVIKTTGEISETENKSNVEKQWNRVGSLKSASSKTHETKPNVSYGGGASLQTLGTHRDTRQYHKTSTHANLTTQMK
jgi:hypothetical protein